MQGRTCMKSRERKAHTDDRFWRVKKNMIFIRYPIVQRDMFMFLCARAHTHISSTFYFTLFACILCPVLSQHRIADERSLPANSQCFQPQPNIVKRDLCVGVASSKNAIRCEKRKKQNTRRRQSAAEAATAAAATANTTYSKQICFAGNYDNSCLVRFPSLPLCCCFFPPPSCRCRRRRRRVPMHLSAHHFGTSALRRDLFVSCKRQACARASALAIYKNQRDEID